MTVLGGLLWGSPEVMLTLLLTSMLLRTQINATHLPTAGPEAGQIATKGERPAYPYRFWQEGKGASLVPATTSKPSSYEYYYKKDEDLGTDPSTWKLLPIQIPDDLVSGASAQEEVTVSSMVPPYPTPVTPLYGRHPGATEPLPPYPPERLHQETASGQGSPESQQLTWNSHDSEGGHKSHVPQREDWDHHDNKVSHGRPAPQQENWDHDKVSHGRPDPQQESWDHHDTDGSHSTREPQHHSWGSHRVEHGNESPEPQHPNWGSHDTDGGHGNSELKHQNWDQHDSEASHETLEPGHSWDRHDANSYNSQEPYKWGHHGMEHGTQHASPTPEHYYNRTHTTDGYEIRNYHEDDQFTLESHASNQNSDQPLHLMPNRPMPWNWKPPDTPSWHQNIVERLGQHLPKLPAFPKLRLPGLGNLPRLPRLPQWIFGGHNRRIHDQEAAEIEGDYVHKFYPLVPENNPLGHLESNLDRHHRPHYKYPPHQDHIAQENTLKPDHNTDKASHHQSHYPSADGGEGSLYTDSSYMPQRPTRPHHHDTQNHGHHSTRNELQMSHQNPQAGHEAPQYTQHTRRPSQSHVGPQRVLKVPHRQAYEGYLEKHHSPPNRHKWTWEAQQKHTTQSYPPQRDPLNRYPSPLHNWLPQGPTRPSSGYMSPNSTRHGQHYRPQTHTAHPQRPYSPTPSHGHPQHQQQHQQQQQASGNLWFSAGQHQHGPEAYDNILDPLSSLLNRPSPFPIIDSSPYQQSIIDRLTGAGTSATTTTLSIPGGLLVLGLALALFYFNFVWYPTPVVTAKIYKMLSDNTPTGSLSDGQQRAVGEVYQVFRGLEKEYKHDSSASSAPCRSRLVCQVHQELPGLWVVTQAYATLVKSSLASGSDGDSGFSGYQAAAQRGSQGEDCVAYYKECALPAAPVNATLKKLLTLLTA